MLIINAVALSCTLAVCAQCAPLLPVSSIKHAVDRPIVAHVLLEQVTPPEPARPGVPPHKEKGLIVDSLNWPADHARQTSKGTTITKHVLWEPSGHIKRRDKEGFVTFNVRESLENQHPIDPEMLRTSLL